MVIEYHGPRTDLLPGVRDKLGNYEYKGTRSRGYSRGYMAPTYKQTGNIWDPTYIYYYIGYYKNGCTSYWELRGAEANGMIKSSTCGTTHFEYCPGPWKIRGRKIGDKLPWVTKNVVVRCGKIW